MTDYTITVNGTSIQCQPIHIPAGNVNAHRLVFVLSDEWRGLVKTAVFIRDGYSIRSTEFGEDNTCFIPPQITETAGAFEFGLSGFEAKDGVLIERLCTLRKAARIVPGAYADNAEEPKNVPMTGYEQLYTELKEHEKASVIAFDGLYEGIRTEGIARQHADEQLSKAIEEESTARSEADAKLKKDLQSELAGKSPTDHTHTTLPTALALTDGKTSTAAYGFAFDNTVTGFADIMMSGTTSVSDFGQSFAPKNRTASSRWINISVPSALMPRHASMPYTLRLTLSMAAQSNVVPLEIMGLYKGGSGDVRVTPISDAWTLSPGETKSFVFNLDTGSTSIKSAGFSIDLKAANAECFDAMRFTVESFTVLPSAKVKTDRKPAFVRFGERYIVPADAPDVNRAVNQFWYADGAVQSFMVDDVGVINAMVADPKLEAASMLVESHNHIIDNENPHGVTAEQTGAYDKTQTDELLANKSTVGHIHPLANVGVNTNLAGIEIRCTSYEGETEPTTVLSYRDETTIEEKYVFPNDQYYSDFSIFSDGDRVSLLFEGNCMITVNGKSISVDGTYTLPETLLTAPIDVMTEFGNEVGVTVLYADPPRDGFMSAEDKETLQGVQASLGDIDTALDAILAIQNAVIGGETA